MIGKIIIQTFLFIFPWPVRKWFLTKIYKMQLGKKTFIGFSYVFASKVVLEDEAKIGHLNFINAIDYFEMGEDSMLGRQNWITGRSTTDSNSYLNSPNRKCEMIVGKKTRITDHHHFDCNGGIYIGDFTTVAGLDTQILTHGVDVYNSQQKANAVQIGDYCFVGTKSIILMGGKLPSFSILGAGALLNKSHHEEYGLYAGSPARKLKELPESAVYFNREEANVY